MRRKAEQGAQRADITRDTLRKLEHGAPTVGFHVVLKVGRALGILDTLTGALDPLNTDLGRARRAPQPAAGAKKQPLAMSRAS